MQFNNIILISTTAALFISSAAAAPAPKPNPNPWVDLYGGIVQDFTNSNGQYYNPTAGANADTPLYGLLTDVKNWWNNFRNMV
ncbi:hypothetical protein TWF569_000498 [Orbilia oligospora]|uniref:Uncharacterized protein n=1 Tax=Orbilia oligospora TaxID=2813651 RepID=A0A7C8NGD0_ORBOL|nr:hypothetical protein TWF102_002454 [Orbilia oligospora]KAF3098283.1 hypothetical protein TWF103_009104 [Orbilia oligospora]KAF3116545.1 hypothetical protein TWF706_004172 [Orbilia oligospora]KAF3120294.1 hypothetical protein TWF703_002673 [Orbilia oligospora]KAF3126612.1 hypothetical protein TWF569_000498 [Orbilia oligospora]